MHERVMLVDDNDADLLFTEIVLRARGIAGEVLTFDTARCALDHLADRTKPRVSLILLDINMPEMDGFAFLAAWEGLRTQWPDAPPVVMLTSSPDPADRARALAHASVRAYLVKPLDDASARSLLDVTR
ncbi:response regulator [Rhizobacter sp. Root1221]|uniref:response regulator n=1 Tax=Rhizobacter sp. Root1221 TaxID=1736433 RepID=UPI0006FD45AD|nr:response regulator [Rhizobacter sp. Root1221]KQV81245.1 response regulator receiver protein [Rhizobacter sp. Root1221]